MKLFTIIMLASLFCYAGEPVTIKTKFDYNLQKQKWFLRRSASAKVQSRSRDAIMADITILAMISERVGYKVIASKTAPIVIPAKGFTDYAYTAQVTKVKTRWTWLIIVSRDGKVIACEWKARVKRLDPKLFLGAVVGDIVKEPDKEKE